MRTLLAWFHSQPEFARIVLLAVLFVVVLGLMLGIMGPGGGKRVHR